MYVCMHAFLQMHQIRGCTLGNGGHAAFASILWSPPLAGDFRECLTNVSCDVLLVFGTDDPWCKPAFARSMISALEERRDRIQNDDDDDDDDATGDTTTNAVNRGDRLSPVHRYVEISHTGHCPNHEAPRAVGHLVNQWVNVNVNNVERTDGIAEEDRDRNVRNLNLVTPAGTGRIVKVPRAQIQTQTTLSFAEEWGETTVRERQKDDIEVGWLDKIVAFVV